MTDTPSSRLARSERTSPVAFYRQVVAELRKVVWPSQQQLVTYFLVVMVFVLVMIALVSALDLGFGKAVFAIFGGDTSSTTSGS
ncbi:MAG TPA: preprotein translocase subunit SecE [Marmoricola sp.]